MGHPPQRGGGGRRACGGFAAGGARMGGVSASVRARAARAARDAQGAASRGSPRAGGDAARPLIIAGAIAACAAAASGLAVLTTLAAIGWVTAPHVGFGSGLSGVLQTVGVLWLVAHHVQLSVHGVGTIGLLPLGLPLLPGLLLVKAGGWMVHAAGVRRLRHVGYAALAMAGPYATLSGAVAVASRTPKASPSLWQAVVAGFILAFAAGGLGAARGLAPWRKLAGLVAPRPRSVILGVLATTAVLAAAGAVLAGGSLATHLSDYRAASDALSPGPGGAAVLLLAQLSYLPNAIIWSVAYSLGPGFGFGVGTMVAPTGSALGALPAFPMLAGLPAGVHAGVPPALAFAVLAAPYAAGVLGGLVTVRVAPTPQLEAAPLWGFVAGGICGLLTGLAAAFSGGPLGSGRLASVGPSGWQTSVVAILEVGVTAAVAAGAANWFLLRGTADPATPAAEPPPRVVDESDDDGGHRIYVDPWAEEPEEED